MQQRVEMDVPALYGLRVIAFFAVLLSHLPAAGFSPLLANVGGHGWVGVELFFVISGFLLFRNLRIEKQRTGKISIQNFYRRRALRIYPLMIVYACMMIALFSTFNAEAFIRLGFLSVFMDNVAVWFWGYNTAIPFTAHLWTLAYEAQVYLLLPIAFLAYSRRGTNWMLAAIGIVAISCFLLRVAVFPFGPAHPRIWVTPILQPESILLGVAMAVWWPKWRWWISAIVAICAGWVFFVCPMPWENWIGNAFNYPAAAIMCGAAVHASVSSRILSGLLGSRLLKYLGERSYGFYVFYAFSKWLATCILAGRILPTTGYISGTYASGDEYLMLLVLTTAITFGLAFASYRWLESPFLRRSRPQRESIGITA